jgi:hypothetical protein
MTALLPLLPVAIEMPRTSHSHVCVQNNSIVKCDFKMLAVAINAFNGRMNARDWAR